MAVILRISDLGVKVTGIAFVQMRAGIRETNSAVLVRVRLPNYFIEAYDTSV